MHCTASHLAEWAENNFPYSRLFPGVSIITEVASRHKHQGCCLTDAQSPEAPTVCLQATKISNKDPIWTPSLSVRFWNENVNKCSLTVGKISLLITVNKQALFWKFKTQTNQVSRCGNQVSRICLPIFKFIEQWAPRKVPRAAKFLS